MVNDGRLCDHNRTLTKDYTFHFFFHLLVLPVSVVICVVVFYRLVSLGIKTPMTLFSKAYVLLVILLECLGAYSYIFRFLVAKHTRIPVPLCATVGFFNWIVGGASYISLQQVFVQRLKTVFSQSSYKIQPWVISLWKAFHISMITAGVVVLSIRAFGRKCYREKHLEGFLVANGIFPHKALLCDSPKNFRNETLEWMLIVTTALICLAGNSTLAWMYIRRLYHVFAPTTESAPERISAQMKAVMRKSLMVALASFFTDLCAFVAGSVDMLQPIYFAAMLNVVFLFCMFRAGQKWYDATLRRLEWVLDWLFASSPQQSAMAQFVAMATPRMGPETSDDWIHKKTEPSALALESAAKVDNSDAEH